MPRARATVPFICHIWAVVVTTKSASAVACPAGAVKIGRAHV